MQGKRKYLIWVVLIALFSLNWLNNSRSTDPKSADLPLNFSAVSDLPEVLKESSGLETASSSEFWSFNDSKGKAALYKFDLSGNLTQTLTIAGAKNIDWEDMTKDQEGNLYIGDFGNNDNERNDLVIYKVKGSDLDRSPAFASSIRFTFPDQTAFPPPKSERFFDVEAIFSKGNHLYLLSRDRSKPFVGKTKLYRLPNRPGKYTAEFLEEFRTDKEKSKGQVTSADLSEDGRHLAMLFKEAVWLFEINQGSSLLSKLSEQFKLPEGLGAEGIVFKDKCALYITNEAKKDRSAGLYRLQICP